MKKIFSFFTTYKAMFVLLGLYAVAMAVATFVEAAYGTEAARRFFYTSWWFILLQGLLAVNFIGISVRRKLWAQRKWGVLLLHSALIVILAGALYTHFFSREGIMHIREGETSDMLLSMRGEPVARLPFSVTLKDFRLERYPGSQSPSSYSSDVVITDKDGSRETRIYMNNIAYVQDYRLYQSSFDRDERGTVLSVNQDLEGTIISYAGYLLLTAGLLISLFHKHSRFRTLARKLKKGNALAVCLLVGWASVSVPARAQSSGEPLKTVPLEVLQRNVISPQSADSLASLLVQNPNGRIEPLNTYASRLLRKIYRGDDFHGLTAEQVIVGAVGNPFLWSRVPLIYVSNKDVQKRYGLTDKYASFNSLFDENGAYKLQQDVESAYAKSQADQSKLEKDILKLDEKMNILHALFQGSMLRLFPVNDSEEGIWLSTADDLTGLDSRDSLFVEKILPWYFEECNASLQTGNWDRPNEIIRMIKVFQKSKADPTHYIAPDKVEKEIYYNRAHIFKTSGLGYLITAFSLLLVLFAAMLRGDHQWLTWLVRILSGMIVLFFLYHAFGIGLRWYISGRAPWTNSYESMIYVAWTAVLAGIVFGRKSPITLAVATLLGGIVIMISQLSWLDPEITPLVPVLKSYWLLFHVAIITASYGFFGMSALLGLTTMFVMIFARRKRALAKIDELTIINEMSQTIGLVLLTVGIFLGAVWANESWGRYWGWDPKETWALITMVVYAFTTHSRFVPALSGKFAFTAMSVFAIYSVLMTFFGVNYYLSGMHSYGNSEGFAELPVVFATVAVVAIAVVAGIRYRRLESR